MNSTQLINETGGKRVGEIEPDNLEGKKNGGTSSKRKSSSSGNALTQEVGKSKNTQKKKRA